MMCDNTNRGFRTQLASILEKLTKVALVEIGNLAEECSSVLHAEITQHKSENEALKKKCYALEIQLRAARGSQNYTANAHTASRRQIGNHSSEKFVSGQQPAAPAIESVFGKDWCIDLWRDDKLQPQSKGTVESAATRNVAIPPVIDLRDGEPDLILVKEELYDESVQHMTRIADNRKCVEVFDETSLHGAGGEQTLQTSDFNSFPVTSGSQTQHTQHTQPMLMDNIIDDSALSSLVEDPNPATAMGEFSDYSNNMHTNATKETAMELRPVKPPKQFECLFCGKIFNYMSSLKVHIRRHSGEKPFSCTVCGKRFAQKTYVKLHQRVHSGEKPYSCQACGKSFSQKSTLNIHLRTHTGEKPYNCVDCGKSYAYKYGFNHHQCLN